MSKIYTSVEQLIGNTPLLELKGIEEEYGVKAKLLGKLEYLNATGSIKDRIARQMIDDAEKDGRLKKGGTIIEPTSGNTGIGLSAVGVSRGYRVIIVMPDSMSVERRKLMKAYGAELVLSEGAKGMKGAIAKADELSKEIPGSWVAGQFVNPSNVKAHYTTTGPEIWNDTNGKVDILVSGVGTGGTLTGTGKYLKEKNPNVKVVAVESDEKMCMVNEARNGENENLKIVKIDSYETDKSVRGKFDYVTIIGNFSMEKLHFAKKFLKPEGKLILAIENKYGIKYWSGEARPDTYSRMRLIGVLRREGLHEQEMYYPVPDHVLPSEIYSSKNLPKEGSVTTVSPSFLKDKILSLDELKTYDMVIRDKKFEDYANSFIIFAQQPQDAEK